MIVVGITGPWGAGKDTSANYLAETMDIPHVSGSEIVKEMLRATGLAVTKETVRAFSIFLRSQYGPSIVIDKAIARSKQQGVIVSGFRSPAEARVIKSHGGIIIYIEAGSTVRYRRNKQRSRVGDPTVMQQFTKLDKMESGGAEDDESLEAIKTMADFIIVNESTIEELNSKLDGVGSKIASKRNGSGSLALNEPINP